MRVISWNLEKKPLIDWALGQFKPDVALFQEFEGTFTGIGNDGVYRSIGPDGPTDIGIAQSFRDGKSLVGTCVVTTGTNRIDKFNTIKAPKGDFRAKFWLGKVYKATSIAKVGAVTFVSFHGYNGTLQGRDPKDLIAHVSKVMKALPDGPVVWAGDFNTFTPEHVQAVVNFMTATGFYNDMRVPYDDKKTLDLVFTRFCKAERVDVGHHESDHPYMVFDITNIKP